MRHVDEVANACTLKLPPGRWAFTSEDGAPRQVPCRDKEGDAQTVMGDGSRVDATSTSEVGPEPPVANHPDLASDGLLGLGGFVANRNQDGDAQHEEELPCELRRDEDKGIPQERRHLGAMRDVGACRRQADQELKS